MDARLITQELLGDGGTPQGRSAGRDLDQIAGRVARSRLNVLITGETGTGKTRLAQRIHAASPRSDKALLMLNCAGMRDAAIERALFGQAQASAGWGGEPMEGILAAADQGTLLLDEVGGLSEAVQARLLRFLETEQIERPGAPRRRVDVRVLATTNRNLQAAVAGGTFRADLLSRLDGVGFALPLLRERPGDIPALAAGFLDEVCEREPRQKPVISPAALATLQRHAWPGNLRELRNVIERAAYVCAGGRIEAGDLMLPLASLDTQQRGLAKPLAQDPPKDVADPPVDRGADSPQPAALQPGAVLGGTYRIVRFIGSGSTGQVYEATHTRLNGRYAIKVLHPHRADVARAIARFEREAQIASGLHHANIVAIFDFDRADDGAPYLVMEYVDGRELTRVIADDGPLPIDRILTIVDQIASALSVVHRRDIVHRDLKPQNILLIPAAPPNKEQVKLVDFGISKTQFGSVALTAESAILGTPQYMAPEQALGSEDVGVRADQFALAAITYEMLTGRKAFPGDRVDTVVYRIVHEDPVPLDATLAPGLGAVLRRALSKDPGRRFPSILDFAAALRAAAPVSSPQAASATLDYQAEIEVVGQPDPAVGPWRRRLPAQRRTIVTSLCALSGGRCPPPGVCR
jgi:serine/threonine protein kinase